MAHSRREEDPEAESISPHITAAMNELALYCMAESDEERLNYVTNPAAVAPKMASWASYVQYKDYLPQEAGRSSKNGDLLQISVLMDDNTIRPAVSCMTGIQENGSWTGKPGRAIPPCSRRSWKPKTPQPPFPSESS